MKTDPLNCNTDSDRLWDGEEYYIETDPLKCDTDGDGLSDHWEVMLWFDPLNANPDGDTFSDYDELINNTSPYEYNLSVDEALGEFWQGALLGDWETADSIEQLVGQIASSFVPFVGDARDYFANITVNMDTVSGLLNLGGFLLDFVAVGAAADAVKIGPKVGKFVEKFAKNAFKVTEGIVQVLKRIPNQSDEILIAVAKAVPADAYDDIAMSIKNGDNITKADYLKLQDLFQAAGKNLDNSIDDILGDLDWDTIVSQKGETRIAHIQRHMIPNPIRKKT